MGRKGERGMGESPVKHDASCGQGLDVGCPQMISAVAAEAVRPDRVDGYEKNI